MPRCIVCDHCSETDGGSRSYQWSREETGYKCDQCISVISNNKFELRDVNDDGEIREHWIDLQWDEADLEKSEVLGVPRLGRHSGETTD